MNLTLEIIRGLAAVREKARNDKRSTAAYWNGDDWGSISGHRDAAEWMEDQEVKYLDAALRAVGHDPAVRGEEGGA